MTTKQTVLAAVLAGSVAAFAPISAPVVATAADAAAFAQSDLDAFMHQVLATRDDNWKKLQQYVLDEHERIDVIGPAFVPLMGERNDYRWYVRDGYFVRSPLTFDGVTVSEAERRKFEDDFLRQAKTQDEHAAARAPRAGLAGRPTTAAAPQNSGPGPEGDPSSQTSAAPTGMDALLAQTRQPQFIDTAYFLRFKFEQGKYALVGREQFEGTEVLRIEYYPARLFSDTQDAERRRAARGAPASDKRENLEIERLMNKNSLVTLWIEPKARQIVKYAFDNVQADFMPAAWFVRLEDAKASMTMSQPFKGVWLPRNVDIMMKALLAVGTLDLRYRLDYVDYREAATSGRIIGRGGLR